jgi:hypothetical protein
LLIELPGLRRVPLGNRLAGLLAQRFDALASHVIRPKLAAVRRCALSRFAFPSA